MVELHFVKLPVGRRFFEELSVGAGVDDFALAHNDDQVGGENRREAMGDGNNGFAGGEFL